MFEKIKELYESGKLTKSGVQKAAAKGWITIPQSKEILKKK